MENKRLNNIISVILSIIIIGGLGYIIYKNFIEIGGNYNTNPSNSNKESVKLNDGDIYKLGKEKYDILYSKNNYQNNNFIFFKDDEVNINNLTNQDKLYLLYSFLSDEDKNKSGEHNDSCNLNKGIYNINNYPENCYKETFDKNLLNEKLGNYFDNNMNVNYEDFYASTALKCIIDNSKYTCYLNTSDFTVPNYTTLIKYDSSKLNDNQLEVYNYLLTIRKFDINGYKKGIYSNSSATNKIDDLPYEISDAISEELTTNLINQYIDKITKYKSTFIKYNNNYVWQKTEIVK